MARSFYLMILKVSVLFSEPKISQSSLFAWQATASQLVSVLFSEPKISQFQSLQSNQNCEPKCFSALQRAENFSIVHLIYRLPRLALVSVLFSEPKISQFDPDDQYPNIVVIVSVLFSEPKISQFEDAEIAKALDESFSALQRAENFSIPALQR